MAAEISFELSSHYYLIVALFQSLQIISSALRIEESKINLNLPSSALGHNKSDIWAHGKEKHVVCMLDSWSYWRQGDGQYNVREHINGNLCTHIIYRAVDIDNNFRLKVHDNHLEINLEYLEQFVRLKRKFPHLKMIISTGGFYYENGATVSTLASLTSSIENRRTFIQSVTQFLKAHKFDGLNLEWKLDYDKLPEKENFENLTHELKAALREEGKMLMVLVPGDAWKIAKHYDLKNISKIVDIIILASVDYHGLWFNTTGHNAPLHRIENLMQNLFVDQRINPKRFVLAIPLYGRNYKLKSPLSGSSVDHGNGNQAVVGNKGPFINEDQMWSYPEICTITTADNKKSSPAWKTFWDKNDLVPFATDGSEWVSFDSPLSIFGKVLLASHFNLGGIAAWTIDNDDFHGQCPGKHKNPLLRTINYAMGLASRTSPLDLCSFMLLKDNTPEDLAPKIRGNITSSPKMTFPLGSEIIVEGVSVGIAPIKVTWSKSEIQVLITQRVLETEETTYNLPPAARPTSQSALLPEVEKSKELPSKDVKCQNVQNDIKPISKSSTFKIANFTKSDIGIYNLESENIFGTTKVSFSLAKTLKKSWRMSTTWTWIVVGIVVLLINLIIGFIIYWRLRKNNTVLTEYEMKAFLRGTDNLYTEDKSPESVPYNKNFELSDNSFKIEKESVLGSGQFGIVYKGFANRTEVAVKSTKEGAEKQYLMSLLSELKILIHLGNHPNIVNLIGASTTNLKNGSVYIFVEFCPHGNLLNYLRGARKSFVSYMLHDKFDGKGELEEPDDIISTHHLVKWSFQIAKALEHLSTKKVIHADLAARNVLVFDRNTVKITDFGLSRKIYNYTNYVKNNQEPLPWRWMAIESLRDLTFSNQSDIWSYGVTLWEIFSLGQTPYSGMSWTTDFVDQLAKDVRIHKPKYATTSLYRVMKKCWLEDPNGRPKAEDLSTYFSIILDESFSKDYEKIIDT